MASFSPRLTRLLIVRGVARALTPVAVLWGIFDWYVYAHRAVPSAFPWQALLFAALTGNYVLIYILSWVAPALLNGPWRIRPWQTFVLLGNAFLLPILFYRRFDHHLPWGFIAITFLFFVGLYAATAIMFYFQDHLPMAGLFAARKAASNRPGPQDASQPSSRHEP